MADAAKPPVGWTGCAKALKALTKRVADLEKVAHPPIDLTPMVDEILAARGYVPTVTDPALTPSQRLAKLLGEAAEVIEGERDSLIHNYSSTSDVEHIDERWAYGRAKKCARIGAGLRAAITELQPDEASDA